MIFNSWVACWIKKLNLLNFSTIINSGYILIQHAENFTPEASNVENKWHEMVSEGPQFLAKKIAISTSSLIRQRFTRNLNELEMPLYKLRVVKLLLHSHKNKKNINEIIWKMQRRLWILSENYSKVLFQLFAQNIFHLLRKADKTVESRIFLFSLFYFYFFFRSFCYNLISFFLSSFLKELSFCHKLKCSHPYVFATWWYLNLWYYKLKLLDLNEIIILNLKGKTGYVR